MLFPCEYTQELKNKKTKFFRNILTLVKRSQNSSKTRFFYFCLKIHPLMCLFFTLRWHTVYDMVRDTFFLFFENRTSGNNLVIQLWPKMLRTNPISGFFDISGNLWRSLENSGYLKGRRYMKSPLLVGYGQLSLLPIQISGFFYQ